LWPEATALAAQKDTEAVRETVRELERALIELRAARGET
jgi:hypothetical protein